MDSREKGKRGERELARKLNGLGFETRRSVQYCGANGDADVVGIPGIHIECKRVENLNIHKAMAQATADAQEGEAPTVFHRRDRGQWLVTMRLADWAVRERCYIREWEE